MCRKVGIEMKNLWSLGSWKKNRDCRDENLNFDRNRKFIPCLMLKSFPWNVNMTKSFLWHPFTITYDSLHPPFKALVSTSKPLLVYFQRQKFNVIETLALKHENNWKYQAITNLLLFHSETECRRMWENERNQAHKRESRLEHFILEKKSKLIQFTLRIQQQHRENLHQFSTCYGKTYKSNPMRCQSEREFLPMFIYVRIFRKCRFSFFFGFGEIIYNESKKQQTKSFHRQTLAIATIAWRVCFRLLLLFFRAR
jgi:hypothetical protein